MNKPLTIMIKETRDNLINICNSCELSLPILDLILQGIYSEVHYLVEKQAISEKLSYDKSLDIDKKDGTD